jgi:hypothetical protein
VASLAFKRENGEREKTEFVNRFKLIWAVQMYRKNISLGRDPKSTPPSALSRLQGGASRSPRTLGAGCVGRFGGALTNEAQADGEVVLVLTPPTLALGSWTDPRTTVAKEPGHRGARNKS